MKRHFLTITDFSKDELERLIIRAAEGEFTSELAGKTAVKLFLEPSTRTSLSFEMAAKNLGMQVLNFHTEQSSLKKGESYLDTLLTLEALGADFLVYRTNEVFIDKEILLESGLHFINGGEGTKEHPSQALLDAVTVYKHFGRLEGLKITIVGDTLHSRVANSNVDLWQCLGSEVRIVSPEQFRIQRSGVELGDHLGQMIATTDVLMMLRWQNERHQNTLESERFIQDFQLNANRLKALPLESIVLHPGPVNWDREITTEIRRESRIKILKQVEDGVKARMAIFMKLAKREF
jgi:aspartate carbamoyltransferase catalytic subunit